MKTKSTQIDTPWQEPLIDFALELYDAPRIEELCLRLQEDYHANVNIILWSCWIEKEKISLSLEWLDDVLVAVDTLSQLTLSRLREVRRTIKDASGFTRVQAKMINKHILSAELTAEKIFLQRLEDLTMRFYEVQETTGKTSAKTITASSYLSMLKVEKAEELAELFLERSEKSNVVPLVTS